MRKRSWTREGLIEAAKESVSKRMLLSRLGLKEAGGNYAQVNKYLKEYAVDISHFTGRAWNRGNRGGYRPRTPTFEILQKGSGFQSFKLKKRLFKENLKKPECEECGWARISEDGRILLELDHINGDSTDNRFENLRVLCPNCHSLKPTHRGRNKGKRASGGIGIRAPLKMVSVKTDVGSTPTWPTLL